MEKRASQGMTTRAVRNNNPGNLEAGTKWLGLMPPGQMTPEQAAETRFAVFEAPKWGFRAMAIILLRYQRIHGLNTVRGIINRWAPPSENNTFAYVQAVCKDIKKNPDAPLDLSNAETLRGLCKAIAVHESGGWFFTSTDLNDGVSLALRT